MEDNEKKPMSEDDKIEGAMRQALDDYRADDFETVQAMHAVLKDVPPHLMEQALEYKRKEGNDLFKRGEYRAALASYNAVLQVKPEDARLWGNRSACQMALKWPKKAVKSAREAIRVDKTFAKGWYRLGVGLAAQNKAPLAVDAFENALRLEPGNAGIKKLLNEQIAKKREQQSMARMTAEMTGQISPEAPPEILDVDHELFRVTFKPELVMTGWKDHPNGRIPESDHITRVLSQHVDSISDLNGPARLLKYAEERELVQANMAEIQRGVMTACKVAAARVPKDAPAPTLTSLHPTSTESSFERDISDDRFMRWLCVGASSSLGATAVRIAQGFEDPPPAGNSPSTSAAIRVVVSEPRYFNARILQRVAAANGVAHSMQVVPIWADALTRERKVKKDDDAASEAKEEGEGASVVPTSDKESVESAESSSKAANADVREMLPPFDGMSIEWHRGDCFSSRNLLCVKHAHKNLLREGAVVAPRHLALYGMLVSIDFGALAAAGVDGEVDLSNLNAFCWRPCDIPFSMAKEGERVKGSIPHLRYSAATPLFRFDLQDVATLRTVDESKINFKLTRSGMCNAIVFWMDASQDPEARCTEPPAMVSLQYLDPFTATALEKIKIVASHNLARAWFRYGGKNLIDIEEIKAFKKVYHKYMLSTREEEKLADLGRQMALNKAVSQAIQTVTDQSEDNKRPRVLGLATGATVTGMAAVRAGASRFLGTERTKHLAELIEPITLANGIKGVRVDSREVRFIAPPHRDIKKYDILVAECFDAGALGEGALILAKHAMSKFMLPRPEDPHESDDEEDGDKNTEGATNALDQFKADGDDDEDEDDEVKPIIKAPKRIVGPAYHVIPRGMIIHAVLVEHRTPPVEGVHLNAWDRYRWNPEYGAVSLDSSPWSRVLSYPSPVFSFDFEHLSQQDITPTARPLVFHCHTEGKANGIVWFFRLQLDDKQTALDTMPMAVSNATMEAAKREGAPVPPKREDTPPMYWDQAVRYISEVPVAPKDTVRFIAEHDGSNIMFRHVAKGTEPKLTPAMMEALGPDREWIAAYKRILEVSNEIMKNLGQNFNEYSRAATTAHLLAAQAAWFRLDPEDTVTFSQMFAS